MIACRWSKQEGFIAVVVCRWCAVTELSDRSGGRCNRCEQPCPTIPAQSV